MRARGKRAVCERCKTIAEDYVAYLIRLTFVFDSAFARACHLHPDRLRFREAALKTIRCHTTPKMVGLQDPLRIKPLINAAGTGKAPTIVGGTPLVVPARSPFEYPSVLQIISPAPLRRFLIPVFVFASPPHTKTKRGTAWAYGHIQGVCVQTFWTRS